MSTGPVDPGLKRKFDTTKMSVEELKLCKVEDVAMPLGKACPVPQQGVAGGGGGQGFVPSKTAAATAAAASRLPACMLAGVAVLTGISTFFYYRSVRVEPLVVTTDSVMVAPANDNTSMQSD